MLGVMKLKLHRFSLNFSTLLVTCMNWLLLSATDKPTSAPIQKVSILESYSLSE